jgi:hypothetical protein
MSNVIEQLPEELRPLLIEIVGEQDENLLATLRTHDEPSQADRETVESLLADEFSRNLGQDFEPTGRGKAIDRLIGIFLLRWPINTD